MVIMPEGDAIRKAVKWVSAELSENPGKPLPGLVEKAVFIYDLSPKDADFLFKFFRESQAGA